jgi:hypothetical protein
MLATLKNHRIVRPALLLTFVLTLTGVASLSKPARATECSPYCMDDCDTELANCQASCPTGPHTGRIICLQICNTSFSNCISNCPVCQ